MKFTLNAQKELQEFYMNLLLLPEGKRLEKIEKTIANTHGKSENVAHVKNLKRALNHGLILKKVHRAIRFNQREWKKPYIDMNNELRQKTTNDFKKDFSS